jgi:hypothetical protein
MKTRPKRPTGQTLAPAVARADHEVVLFNGHLIPVLGVIGGSPAESRETARNIEAFVAATKRSKEAS